MIEKAGVDKGRVRLLVDALRSGEFTQTTGTLKMVQPTGEAAHCCLGVACEVAIRNGLDIPVTFGAESDSWGSVSFDGELSLMPPSVYQWFGFTYGDPWLNGSRATKLNDGVKWDFGMIADAFEQEFLR